MLKIGITGGIGSGKSVVCSVFEKLGISVYNADKEAKEVINTDPFVKKELISIFGSTIYGADDKINKKELSTIIFNNEKALNQVNSIVHPAVRKHFLKWVERKQNQQYVVKEAAILFESGAYKDVDIIISVFAPKDLRIQRVMNRDKVDKQWVIERMNNQWSEEEKIAKSDFVIYNDDTQLVIPQILKLYHGNFQSIR